MKKDQYGQIILNESDLVDLVMQGRRFGDFQDILVEASLDADLLGCQQYRELNISVQEFDRLLQSHWHMPEKYQTLDVSRYILDRCTNDHEIQRCKEELDLFQKKNLIDLLRYVVYLVELMRENQVIWGVGRGSSVASFVLFKIGIHKINSLEYELDFRDFLR